MATKLGENILKHINELQITQKELASMVGVTDTTMSRYINGTREPKIEILSNIATVLKTSIDELVGQQLIESEDDESIEILKLIARNKKSLSNKRKKEIINLLLPEEE